MKKRAQAWSFDIMVAMIIFLAAVSLFYFYSINYKQEGEDILSTLQYDGNAIADVLLSEGYPTNWNQNPSALSTLLVPGILTANKVDENKVANLSNLDYTNKLRPLMHTKYDFCFNFTDSSSNPCVGGSISNPDNLILISRMTIYKNKPTLMNLYIWD